MAPVAVAGFRGSLGRDGKPAPDLRLRAWMPPGESRPSLLLQSPDNAWGRAGLHTGDRLLSLNGAPVQTVVEFRNLLGGLGIGDTVRIEVSRPAGTFRATVPIIGYDRPFVRIEERPGATGRQRALRGEWLAGK